MGQLIGKTKFVTSKPPATLAKLYEQHGAILPKDESKIIFRFQKPKGGHALKRVNNEQRYEELMFMYGHRYPEILLETRKQ